MATGGESESSDGDSKSSSKVALDMEGLAMTFAKCKWFNVAKGFGFVSPDCQSAEESDTPQPTKDIFVYQSAIKMSGFRSLKDGEAVEVWYKISDKGYEAVHVSGPGGLDCLGSDKRPKRRKRAADRCYNCGEGGHHAKECQLPPLPKRCHHCKSVDHLVADCPSKRDRSDSSTKSEGNPTQGANGSSYHSSASEQQRQLPQPTNTSSKNNPTSLPPSTSSPTGETHTGLH